MELKKILIEKMEGNKSIQRSDEQRNLYKALVKAYEADKTILNTYGESTILKRRREDDDQEGPSAGPNRGSKRQKEGAEHASASTPSEKTTCQMEETPFPVYETGADDQPIVQTFQHPECEDDGNDEEDQGLRVSEEQRLIEEEEADELYRDVDINQGRGLQLSADIEESHVTLTLVNPDGQQESSSVSSQFVSSMLNPTSDAGMESIFATASSPMAPLQTSTPIMTPSTIATITTISHAPIPPTTILSEVLQNLPTFDSVFRFEDRLKSLEVNFSEFIQTNQFAKAVSNILGIVHQYMNQQMTEAVQEAVQIQTDRLRDSYQRENDEFLRKIDDNMKRIIKEQVKIVADLSEMELKKILIEKMEGNKEDMRMMMIRKAPPLDQTGGLRDEEKIEEPSHPVLETGAEDQPIVQTSQHPEWFPLPKKPPTLDRDLNKTLPAVQGSAQTWISELAKQADSRSLISAKLYMLKDIKKRTNRIKTGQKREAWRRREKVKAVTVDKGRKTEQNAKRMVENPRTVKKLSKFKEEKKRQGPNLQIDQSSSRGAFSA
nr:hypothetical protein [Tanacetum cinerariifolium]